MSEKDKLVEKADRHFTKKEFAKAVEAYTKYLEGKPSDAQVTARLGDCFALTGSKGKAIRYYAKAAELYALGGAVMKAIGLYKKVLALDPSMSDTNTYLSYLELSRLEAESKSGKKVGMPIQRDETRFIRIEKPQVSIPAAPSPKTKTSKPDELVTPAPPPEEPLLVSETSSSVTDANPPVRDETPSEPVFVLADESKAFLDLEPANQGLPPELLMPGSDISTGEAPPPSPPLTSQVAAPATPEPLSTQMQQEMMIEKMEAPAPEPPLAAPRAEKPTAPGPVSIQKQQEVIMRKMEESGLGRPPGFLPEEIVPPPDEPVIPEEAPAAKSEPTAPALDLGDSDIEFKIESVPETVDVLRQPPGEVPKIEKPAPKAVPPPAPPPAVPPASGEIPSDYELSLPVPEEIQASGEMFAPLDAPLYDAPAEAPVEFPSAIMDLESTPLKDSQPSFEIPLLRELTRSEFVQVCEKLKVHNLKPNTILFRQGDPGESLFYINSGKVKIYLGTGREEETLAYLKEGDIFGEFAFLTGAPRQANVKTDQETELLELSREDLEPVMISHPRIRDALINFYKERALNNVLNQTILFRHLGKIEKALVASNLSYKSFKKDEVIIEEGTEGDELYFLVTGKARVTTYHNLVFVADLYPPELFGEISLITNQPRTATVTAETPVEVLYLKKEQLMELLRRYPKMQNPLKQLYEARLQDIRDKVEQAKKSRSEGGAPYLT